MNVYYESFSFKNIHEDGAAELIENNNKLGSLEETIKVTQLASLEVKRRTEKY